MGADVVAGLSRTPERFQPRTFNTRNQEEREKMKTNMLLTVAIGLAAAASIPERPSLADRIGQLNQQINVEQKQNQNKPGKHEVVYLTIQDGYRTHYSTNGPVVSVTGQASCVQRFQQCRCATVHADNLYVFFLH
jgi:hypothetical protein